MTLLQLKKANLDELYIAKGLANLKQSFGNNFSQRLENRINFINKLIFNQS